MKKLVVYFSRTGENSVNGQIEVIEKGYTEIVAEKIAKYAEADVANKVNARLAAIKSEEAPKA